MNETRTDDRDLIFSAQAQRAVGVLACVVAETVPRLLTELVGETSAREKEKLLFLLRLELFVFGLHLTDEFAFTLLRAAGRASFMNSLLPIVLPEKTDFESFRQFKELYNMRTPVYGSGHELFPEDKKDLRGTVFWDFGKTLAVTYADGTPEALVGAALCGMTFMQALSRAFGEENGWPGLIDFQ